MITPDVGKAKLNSELAQAESKLPPYGRAEKKAERQAEKAEEEFRASKGYPPIGLRAKIHRLLHRKNS